MIIDYIVEENIFVVIVYKILEHNEMSYKNCIKINGKQSIKMPRKR